MPYMHLLGALVLLLPVTTVVLHMHSRRARLTMVDES
jgi:hypothetical protein